jgi:hypothetical protein
MRDIAAMVLYKYAQLMHQVAIKAAALQEPEVEKGVLFGNSLSNEMKKSHYMLQKTPLGDFVLPRIASSKYRVLPRPEVVTRYS